jgi:D-glycero-D-manno-heptose 1,7-bisphosphate phosphatase
MKPGIFFERDGVLNLARVERQQQIAPFRLEDFQINSEAIEPLRELKAAGFTLIATTNQPGVSRGNLSRRELDLMHAMLRRRLGLDDVLLCPHDEMDRCSCRKPKPGLLTEAAFKWHLDLDHSYVVSDKWQDAQAAHIVGCTSLLIRSPWNGSGHHDFILRDLSSAVQKILQIHASPACSVMG